MAEESYFDNLDFLFKHWTLKEIEHFIEKSEQVKKILERMLLHFVFGNMMKLFGWFQLWNK